jgi:hypothetical protein
MAGQDRLHELAACHVVLRHHGLTTLAAYCEASPAVLCQLHPHEAEIRRLVERAHPDVLRCLWPPDPEVHWQVAGLTTEPTARLLSVWRGQPGGAHTDLLKLRYECGDARGERIAWQRLRDVLR